MKKLFVLVLIAMLVAITVPVAAAGRETVGDRLEIYLAPEYQTFPAGAPFYISHGWMPDLRETPVPLGLFDFVLEVDGEVLEEDFKITTNEGPGVVKIQWVNNFPDGMSGVHTFTGHWYGACAASGEPCEKRNEILELWIDTIEVTFTTP